MTDLPTTIEAEIAKELIQALIGGFVELVKKVPALFRRAGKLKEEQRAIELENSKAELAAADAEDLHQVRQRQAVLWEGRLADLLAEHPDARAELEEFLTHMRQHLLSQPGIKTQHITASAHGAIASGAMDGNVIHHHYGAQASRRPPPPDADCGNGSSQR